MYSVFFKFVQLKSENIFKFGVVFNCAKFPSVQYGWSTNRPITPAPARNHGIRKILSFCEQSIGKAGETKIMYTLHVALFLCIFIKLPLSLSDNVWVEIVSLVLSNAYKPAVECYNIRCSIKWKI